MLGAVGRAGAGHAGHALFGGDVLELDGRVVVGAATGRTQAVHGGLDVVVAELTYLAGHQQGRRTGRQAGAAAYLVAAGTRAEVSVGQVELLDAERTALVLVVVDELVILEARHGVCVCGVCVCVERAVKWPPGERGAWAGRDGAGRWTGSGAVGAGCSGAMQRTQTNAGRVKERDALLFGGDGEQRRGSDQVPLQETCPLGEHGPGPRRCSAARLASFVENVRTSDAALTTHPPARPPPAPRRLCPSEHTHHGHAACSQPAIGRRGALDGRPRLLDDGPAR